MLRLSPSEEVQKAKDQNTLDHVTQRFLGLSVPDEIDEATLLQVKTRWNTYAPISRIPNETLLEIFMIVKDHEEFSFTDRHRITQICGHWRDVAINTPGLWTDLPTRSHEYTLVMLERSKSAPLSVQIEKGTPTATIHAVLTHMDRIRTLDLQLPSSGLIDAQNFLAKEGRHALCLEELIVERDEEEEEEEEEDARFTFCLDAFKPSNRLRRLTLNDEIRHTWDILTCHNLTHLTLLGAYCERSISLRSFMEHLRLIPELQSLEIDLGATRFDNNVTERRLLFEHPKLSSLEIYGSGYQQCLVNFLAHTAFPSLKRLYVNYFTNPEDQSAMILAILHTLKRGQFGTPYALHVLPYFVTLHCRLDPHCSAQTQPQFDMRIQSDSRANPNGDYILVREVLDWTIRLNDGISSPLVAVRPTSLLRLTASEFRQLFERLPKLEEITVYDNTITFLIEALSHDPEGTQFTSFPGLRRIHWWKGQKFTPTQDTLSPTIFNDFARSLQIRRRRNLAIHSLHLRGSFEQHEIDLLSDGVLEINISER